MREVGVVEKLWVYPVKSLKGEERERVAVEHRGVEGDRKFALATSDGRFGSGKTTKRRFREIPGLLRLAAYYSGDEPMIRFPDGEVVSGFNPVVHARLSKELNLPIMLRAEKTISHFDGGSIHLLTSGSLDWIRSHLPSSVIDERRFRPNVLIRTPQINPVELGWIGRVLRIGEVVVRVVDRVDRCAMTAHEQSDLPLDRGIPSVIGRFSKNKFGVYADVVSLGHIEVGMAITLTSD